MSFRIIAVTPPTFLPDEESRIIEILDSGEADLVHIRKPESSFQDMKHFIERIPARLHAKLKIHDHFPLLEEFGVAGVHLNSRNPVAPYNAISISKSLHSLEELSEADDYDYVTLSPIFDSISKIGYKAAFEFETLKAVLKDKKNVIALGGVTPDKFPFLKSIGFSGGALLSYFFNESYSKLLPKTLKIQ